LDSLSAQAHRIILNHKRAALSGSGKGSAAPLALTKAEFHRTEKRVTGPQDSRPNSGIS
jgi:hypothetical protein